MSASAESLELQIFAQRAVEQARILAQQRDIAADVDRIDVGQIHAAEQHRAADRLHESRQRLQQRGLAAPFRPSTAIRSHLSGNSYFHHVIADRGSSLPRLPHVRSSGAESYRNRSGG
jgi:hypothetical protein